MWLLKVYAGKTFVPFSLSFFCLSFLPEKLIVFWGLVFFSCFLQFLFYDLSHIKVLLVSINDKMTALIQRPRMTVCSLQQNTDENMHPALDLYFVFQRTMLKVPSVQVVKMDSVLNWDQSITHIKSYYQQYAMIGFYTNSG